MGGYLFGLLDDLVAGRRDRNTTDAEWRELLSPDEFRVLRLKGTERAFTGIYVDTKTPGMYRCKCCGEVLFDSGHKYESGSGWPSFDRPATDRWRNGGAEFRRR